MRGLGWMVGAVAGTSFGWMIACGTPTNDGPQAAESSSSAGAIGCAGGAACNPDQVCVAVDERCECDPGYEHCTLLEVTPACSGVPFDCMDAVDTDACHVMLACGTTAGRIDDGVLTCDPIDACVGSCDSVGGCQTAGGDASGSDTADASSSG